MTPLLGQLPWLLTWKNRTKHVAQSFCDWGLCRYTWVNIVVFGSRGGS